jgi:hypothetical protein
MKVRHHVPASRVTLTYFLRWWFWKGISRARVDAIHGRTELGIDLRDVPHNARVPRYVWGQVPRSVASGVLALFRGHRQEVMRHAMHLVYCVGYIRACWHRDVLPPAPTVPAVPVMPTPAVTGHVEGPSR